MQTMPGYKLTEDDRLLIRGMNQAQLGFNYYTRKVERNRQSNIAALHFDGPVLAQMTAYMTLNPKLPQVG